MAARPASSARSKPPLDVDALWAIEAHRRADARARRTPRVRAGDVVRHGQQRRHAPSCGCSRPATATATAATKPRRLTAGDKDSDPRWSPDGKLDRVHRQAQGRRRGAGLPDRARRRRGDARSTQHRDGRVRRSSGFPTASASPSCRGCGRSLRPKPRRRSASKETQGREGQGARDRARRVPLLGPLADRRPRAARLRRATSRADAARSARRAPASRCSRGSRRRSTTTSRPTAARSRCTVDLAAEPGMMNQRDIVVVDLATRRRREHHVGQRACPTSIRVYSPDGRRSRITRSTRSARSTTRASCAMLDAHGTVARGAGAALDRATSTCSGRPIRARCCSLIEDRGRVGLWRLPGSTRRCADAGRRRRRHRRGFARSARRQRARVRARHGPSIRRRCSRLAATAAASARSRR